MCSSYFSLLFLGSHFHKTFYFCLLVIVGFLNWIIPLFHIIFFAIIIIFFSIFLSCFWKQKQLKMSLFRFCAKIVRLARIMQRCYLLFVTIDRYSKIVENKLFSTEHLSSKRKNFRKSAKITNYNVCYMSRSVKKKKIT